MIIQPIVEGYGEVAAFPVLLRRLVEEAQAWNVSIGTRHGFYLQSNRYAGIAVS